MSTRRCFPAEATHVIAVAPLPARLLLTLVATIAPAAAAAQDHEHSHSDIGVVEFEVSCAAAVQEDFNHALGMLHHMMYQQARQAFMYQQARQAFERIAEQDPDCAMAYWGIATTLFQPLWPARPSAEYRQRGWRLSSAPRSSA